MKNLNFVQLISIEVSDYLTCELAEKISLMQWHSSEPDFVNRVKHLLYDGKVHSDCFNVIAFNTENDVVGRLYCLKNQQNPELWNYGNLAVATEYRRQHIASKMLSVAIETLKDRSCLTLRTYVEKENNASLKLQKMHGFMQKPYQKFDTLINDGQLMFEKSLDPFHVSEATVNDAIFITMIYGKNADVLHGKSLMFDEWKKILAIDDPDEMHFLIHKGAMPVAWLKINGLMNNDIAWISMLAVEPCMQHKGIGTYAVQYAEKYIKAKGFSKVGIHTTGDNIPAQKLYEKCGYSVIKQQECVMGDGTTRTEYTFEKML